MEWVDDASFSNSRGLMSPRQGAVREWSPFGRRWGVRLASGPRRTPFAAWSSQSPMVPHEANGPRAWRSHRSCRTWGGCPDRSAESLRHRVFGLRRPWWPRCWPTRHRVWWNVRATIIGEKRPGVGQICSQPH